MYMHVLYNIKFIICTTSLTGPNIHAQPFPFVIAVLS